MHRMKKQREDLEPQSISAHTRSALAHLYTSQIGTYMDYVDDLAEIVRFDSRPDYHVDRVVRRYLG